jgi:hypothetical protein
MRVDVNHPFFFFFLSFPEVASGMNRLMAIPVNEWPDNLLSVSAKAENKMLLASQTQSAGMTRKNNLPNRWDHHQGTERFPEHPGRTTSTCDLPVPSR